MKNKLLEKASIKRLIKGQKVKLPTKIGNFNLIPFKEEDTGIEHIVLIKGNPAGKESVLCRIHSACATGDLFGSLRCDCGEQLHDAMQQIESQGCGVIVYLQQEGRGIGLMNKIHAYKLQEEGMDTVDANLHLGFAPDERNYFAGAEILKQLQLVSIKLLTNNPEKTDALTLFGIKVVAQVPLIIEPNKFNEAYLNTKQQRMGHLLNQVV